MFFYSQLENLCKIKGIKPSNLVESLGMSKGTMSNWKKGGTPNADAVVRIAEHFGVTTDYLLTGKETSSIPISQEDKEWLSLIHQLPLKAQYEFKGELKGYLKRFDEESVAADSSLSRTGTDNLGK